MDKNRFEYLVSDSLYERVQKAFNTKIYEVSYIGNLKLDPKQWIDFSIKNFDEADQKFETAQSYHSEGSRTNSTINIDLDRNEHNSFEINYGRSTDSNEQLKDLISEEGFNQLKMLPEYALVRLIVKFPGHGTCFHYDDLASFNHIFGHKIGHKINSSYSDLGKVVRYWFSPIPWEDGHVMQISKKMIYGWNPGDVWDIPVGAVHAAANFGYTPQFTVSLTGVVYD